VLLRLALLPFPYYLLLLGAPWSFAVPGMLLAVLIAGAFTKWERAAEAISSLRPLSPATESVPA
jgi:predicted PurR-regulated permease PerM